MRPRELPPVPQDGSWDEAEVGAPIEGRHEPPRQVEGGRVQHQGGKKPTKRSRSPPRARQEGVRETYRTPPSSWTEIREQPALGSQTGQAGSSELERELEKEMFERIQEENLQLKEEIERLRQRESASSWSQLSEKTSPVPPPPRREWESENRARFTPGGTQVPSTPPPTEEVEMPVFPWWVGSRDQEGVPHEVARGPGGVRGASECGGDKVCLGPKVEERGKECDGLRGWQEMERKNVEVMTPLEARAAWLEREAKRLQEAMRAANQGDGRRLKSTYWSTPFERVSEREQEEAHDEERDSLKAIPIVLPKLPEPDVRNAPLEAGDWIAQLTPLIGDVSTQAASWWSFVMSQVTKRYHSWLEAGPLDKLNIGCPDPVQMARGHVRLAQRITTLLMGALPESLRQELVATRQLHVPGIMFSVFRKYQPGGLREKTQTLAELTNTKPASKPSEAVERLRLWRRQLLRATELNAALPDPVLQVRALDVVMQDLLKRDAQASFRISAFRLQHQVDVRPDTESVQKFFELLLAEADLMQHARQEDLELGVLENGEAEGRKSAAIKQLGGPPNVRPPARVQVCRFWGSETGCRLGRNCRWQHDWSSITDKSSRCWLCSSKAHVKQDCPSLANNSCDTAGGSGPGVSQWKGQGKSEGKGSKGKKGKSSGNGANTTAPTQESDAKSGESMPEVKSMQTEDAKSAASTEAGSGKGGQEELMTQR